MNKAIQLSNQVKSINLDVDGMTCAACAARVERVLTKNEHVLDASVSFPLKSAIVDIADNEIFDFDLRRFVKNFFCSVIEYGYL